MVIPFQDGQCIGVIAEDLKQPLGFIKTERLMAERLFQQTDRASQVGQLLLMRLTRTSTCPPLT